MNKIKKSKRRITSLLISAAMLISLTACSGQQRKVSDVTVKTSASSSAEESSQTSNHESSVWHPSTDNSDESSEVSAESQTESDISQAESDISQSESEISQTGQSSDTSPFAVPEEFQDNGIFSGYYDEAYRYMSSMTLEEKVGQMIMSAIPAEDRIETARDYHLGGYVLFGNDFAGKTKEQVISMISSLVISQKIPLSIAVDEEGGTVTRISAKPALSPHEFMSPRDLYKNGGMAYIQSDADEKASLLKELGIDINFAPVCDIATDKKDFMYDRSLGEDAKTTSEFVRIVTEISMAKGVSVTLKHFPGYGSNADTHTGSSVDKRTMKELEEKDIVPFRAGINAGAEFVMVSHNIVTAMDDKKPASLSENIHKYLREKLGFTGLIITDDLSMAAITNYAGENTPAVAAVLAGNDIVVIGSSMIEQSVNSIIEAVNNGKISQKTIDRSVMRIIARKYQMGMM